MRSMRFVAAAGTVWMATAAFQLAGCAPATPREDLKAGPSFSAAPSPKPGAVDEDAPEEFTTTTSGLKYRIRRRSDGTKPAATNTVTVHYEGWLDDGTEFDSSYKRRSPAKFPLNGVVAGWTEGLQLIGEGGMIELEIPAELGYGAQGQARIPANSTLHFLVELIKVE